MVAVVMRIPCGFGCFAGAEGPARFFSPPERIVASTAAGGVDVDQARTEGDDNATFCVVCASFFAGHPRELVT